MREEEEERVSKRESRAKDSQSVVGGTAARTLEEKRARTKREEEGSRVFHLQVTAKHDLLSSTS